MKSGARPMRRAEVALEAEQAADAVGLGAPSEPMLAEVTPTSSASISAKAVHATILNHWSSPWRTTGPNTDLLMRSGRMQWVAGVGQRCGGWR